MRPRHPVALYRPMRTNLGDGGYDESTTVTDLGTIYVISRVHEAQEQFIADVNTDVRVADVIVADAGSYRVTGVERVLGAPHKILSLDRITKPFVPNIVEIGS